MTRLDDLKNYNELFAGRYKIIRFLNKDYLGTSYLAADTVLDDFNIELKIFNPNLYCLAVDKEKLYHELQISREISHANSVRIFEVNKTDELVFISREHVDGVSLKETLLSGSLDIEESRKIIRDICAGLAAIHEQGIIHGNLYPSSIFRDKTGFTKVADFGVSFSPYSDAIEDKDLLQIIKYKAPEISKNNPESKQSDLYSLGVVIYELLTGRLPIEGETIEEINSNILNGAISEISEPLIPPNFKRICLKLLNGEPNRRGMSIVETLKFFAGSSVPVTTSDENPTILPSQFTAKSDVYQSHSTLANPGGEVTSELRQGIVTQSEQARLMSAFKIHTAEAEEQANNQSSEPDPIYKLGILGFSLIIFPLIAAQLLTPWQSLAAVSLNGQLGLEFFFYYLLVIAGMSFLISTPAVASYFILCATTQGRASLKIWFNLTALVTAIYLCLITWGLLQNQSNTIISLIRNPSALFAVLRDATEFLVQITHLIPKYSSSKNDIIYYSFIAVYCLGAIGIIQASSLRKERGVFIGALGLSLVIYLECVLPSFKAINMANLTGAIVPIPIGAEKITITGYDLVCGLINWGVVSLLMIGFELKNKQR